MNYRFKNNQEKRMTNLSNYRDSLNQDDKRRFKISK